jgi:ABC-type lipoprotein export system ATPase subunit
MNNRAWCVRQQDRAPRRHIVFQSFALLPTYSTRENIDLTLRLAGVVRREQRCRMEHVLGLVGLQRWAGHRPFELSGGQQQHLTITWPSPGRCLILADEPPGELDSVTGQQILELFWRVVEYPRTAVLMAIHDLTVDLQDGCVVPPQELLRTRLQQASDAASARAAHLTEDEVSELIERARGEVHRENSTT